jgi:predicted amidophosphoribosyltransferase
VKYCVHCNFTTMRDNAVFCPLCSDNLISPTMICKECNGEVIAEDRFCIHCGKEINKQK